MTLDSFLQSVATDPEPPDELAELPRALWFARKGRWHEAHEIVQEIPSRLASWIHAHLHTIEGDLSNASYWYHKAGRPATDRAGLDAEWEMIAAEVMGKPA